MSGDSSVTAHYRLGVGINNAFLALGELGRLVSSLNFIGASHMNELDSRKSEIEHIVHQKEQYAKLRLKHLLQFQLSTMFFESYCSFTVLFDLSQQNYGILR